MEHFRTAHAEAGGVVSFIGQVRGETEPDPVEALYLEAHPTLTESGIEAAITKTRGRFNILGLDVAHRTGLIPVGETIVYIATAARHRRDAFLAADFMMDYLKTEAIFWKREHRASGTHWIEPRAKDYKDAERWQNLA